MTLLQPIDNDCQCKEEEQPAAPDQEQRHKALLSLEEVAQLALRTGSATTVGVVGVYPALRSSGDSGCLNSCRPRSLPGLHLSLPYRIAVTSLFLGGHECQHASACWELQLPSTVGRH